MADPVLSLPHAPLWERTFDLPRESFRRAGTEMEMGLKLYPAFIAAGLPAPDLRAQHPVGGGPDYPGYHYFVGLVRSVLPMMKRLGMATVEKMGIETLRERLRNEVAGPGGVVAFPSITKAWTRKRFEQDNRARKPGVTSSAPLSLDRRDEHEIQEAK